VVGGELGARPPAGNSWTDYRGGEREVGNPRGVAEHPNARYTVPASQIASSSA